MQGQATSVRIDFGQGGGTVGTQARITPNGRVRLLRQEDNSTMNFGQFNGAIIQVRTEGFLPLYKVGSQSSVCSLTLPTSTSIPTRAGPCSLVHSHAYRYLSLSLSCQKAACVVFLIARSHLHFLVCQSP